MAHGSGTAPVDEAAAWFYRDASLWSSPDTRKLKKVHLRHPDSKSRFGHARALCGNIALIDGDSYGTYANPPARMKCKRCIRCITKKG